VCQKRGEALLNRRSTPRCERSFRPLINRHVTLRPGVGRALRIVATIVLVVTYFLGIEGHEVFGFSVPALSTGVLLIRVFDAPGNKSRFAPVRLMCA
jgi:hypothetical protein